MNPEETDKSYDFHREAMHNLPIYDQFTDIVRTEQEFVLNQGHTNKLTQRYPEITSNWLYQGIAREVLPRGEAHPRLVVDMVKIEQWLETTLSLPLSEEVKRHVAYIFLTLTSWLHLETSEGNEIKTFSNSLRENITKLLAPTTETHQKVEKVSQVVSFFTQEITQTLLNTYALDDVKEEIGYMVDGMMEQVTYNGQIMVEGVDELLFERERRIRKLEKLIDDLDSGALQVGDALRYYTQQLNRATDLFNLTQEAKTKMVWGNESILVELDRLEKGLTLMKNLLPSEEGLGKYYLSLRGVLTRLQLFLMDLQPDHSDEKEGQRIVNELLQITKEIERLSVRDSAPSTEDSQ